MQQIQNMQSEALRIFLLPGCTIRMLTTEHTSQSTRGKLKKKSPTMQQYRKLLLQQKTPIVRLQLQIIWHNNCTQHLPSIFHVQLLTNKIYYQVSYFSDVGNTNFPATDNPNFFLLFIKVQTNQMSSLESHRREKWTCEEGLFSFCLILQQAGMHTDRICSQSNNCMLMNFQVMKL